MNVIAPLISDLAVMLGLAAFVILIFQRIHQPVVLGYLVAGIIIGPYTPPHSLVSDIKNIKILSELGVIFLMFSLGLEFSFQKLTRVGFSAAVIGVFEVVLMIAIGYLVGSAIGWSHFDSIFLGAALSISSTTIIIKAIEELGFKNKRFSELIFAVLIVEDLLAILLLVALSTMVVTHDIMSFAMTYAALKLILVVGSWFLIGYFVVPTLFRRIGNYLNNETLTILSIALCLCLVWLATTFHYSAALGAFIMGSILAETFAIHRIETLIRPVRDIFAAVFFISVGMLIDPQMIWENWGLILLFTLVTIVGKLLTTTLGAFLTGQSLSTSLRTGFSMAQIGEFSFIIVTLGVSLKVASAKLYPIIVAVSILTTFTTPYLIRLSGYAIHVFDKKLSARSKFILKSYSAWVYRMISTSKKNKALRTMIIRLCINAIIVAVIFSTIHYSVFHFFKIFPENSNFAKGVFLFVALILSSPFIWGMLFSYRISKQKLTNFTLMSFFVWLITLAEVALLSLIYYATWVTVALFILVLMAFVVFTFRFLEHSYRWFEKHLVTNINVMDALEKKYEDLAPWDSHLVEIEVGEHSRFIGKEIGETHIRDHYGVNIVAITRGHRTLAAPRGEEKILAYDRLIVLGNDEQIDAFRKEIEVITTKVEPISVLNSFALQAFFLDSQHPLVGKTIRNSKIRERFNGLIVGLERNNERILNPNPDMMLQTDDLLLIVGEIKKFYD